MRVTDRPVVAVIADAHFHDIESDYEYSGIENDGNPLVLRSWSDTRRSSRVFNESGTALQASLLDIEKRGIQHVVLLGDYTDDGQREATQRLVTLLRKHHQRFGTNFYVIPGNHDYFGPSGKHQSTRFKHSAGHTVLVTSDTKVASLEKSTAVLTNRMFRLGGTDAILAMSEFGLSRQVEYIHWETPFGLSDALNSRMFDIRSADGSVVRQVVDASYLVEPVQGLWLLMLDINVFVPRTGNLKAEQKQAFKDSSNAGWNLVQKHKPHLVSWIENVCKRAKNSGKKLIAFSHYPIIDVFDDALGSELKLFGQNTNIRRKPGAAVSAYLIEKGLNLHFGGHLHVNGTSRSGTDNSEITDIAVPSLVAFPPCYKTIDLSNKIPIINTISLDKLEIDKSLVCQYQSETEAQGMLADKALHARHYGEFHYLRMYARVLHHYLPSEWPKNIVDQIFNFNISDLVHLLLSGMPEKTAHPIDRMPSNRKFIHIEELSPVLANHSVTIESLNQCSVISLIVDWYCLRLAGDIALTYINPDRQNIYQFLATEFGNESIERANDTDSFIRIFLGMLNKSLERALDPDSASGLEYARF